MIGGYDDSQALVEKSVDCRPDPEDMIQRERKKIEECKKVEKAFYTIQDSSIYVNDRDGSLARMLGEVRFRKHAHKRALNEWLKQINKEVKE